MDSELDVLRKPIKESGSEIGELFSLYDPYGEEFGYIRIDYGMDPESDTCSIKRQYIRPENRRQGFMRLLQSNVLTRLKQRGWQSVYAYVPCCIRAHVTSSGHDFQRVWQRESEGDWGGYASLKTLLTPVLEDGIKPLVRITKIRKLDSDLQGNYNISLGVEISLLESGVQTPDIEGVVERMLVTENGSNSRTARFCGSTKSV